MMIRHCFDRAGGRLLLVSGIAWTAAATLLPLSAAGEEPSPRIALTAENNNFVVDQDRHYVNGVNFSWLTAPLGTQSWTQRTGNAVENALPLLFPAAGEHDRRIEWTFLGQQLYTPANKTLAIPDPADRPYAGWTYVGGTLMQNRDRRRYSELSATLGVVGPGAFGSQVQNGFHKIFGFGNANGWPHQLRNEPAITLGYVSKWRLVQVLCQHCGLAADVVPEVGATIGNVFTYGEATALVRMGWGLDSSYGPRMLQPGLTGGGYFNASRGGRRWGVQFFGGIQERVVGHNLFLDGNTYQSGPSVHKYNYVHDEVFGFSAYAWRDLRADFTVVRRSREFHGQHSDDRYGSITLSSNW